MTSTLLNAEKVEAGIGESEMVKVIESSAGSLKKRLMSSSLERSTAAFILGTEKKVTKLHALTEENIPIYYIT